MSTLRATNIKNPDSGSNNIVLSEGGGVVISGVTTITTLNASEITGVSGGMVVSGVTTVSAGSTSAPSISPSGDNNTGVFFPSADTIAFAEGGAEVARFDSSGRLLVGTFTSRGNFFNTTGFDPGFQLEGTGYAGSSASLTRNSNDGIGPHLLISKTRGTANGSNTIVQSGDTLGRILFSGADGTDLPLAASIDGYVDGTPGNNDMPGRLVFSTTADGASSPTERVRITSSGYLKASNDGSYISSTATINEIVQAANDAALIVYGSNASLSGTNVLQVRAARNTTNSTYDAIAFYEAASASFRFYVRDSGNVQNTNNSYGAISDIKLKENVVDANSQWDDLRALQVRNYNFKEGQTHTQIGLIAQEVELVSPGLVTESPDRDAEGNDLGTVTKSVNYSVLYMKAVKALQEAMERIETLEASNNDLAARVAALEGN